MSLIDTQLVRKPIPFAVKTVDVQKRVMTVVASVQDVDRDGDVILIDGIDLKFFQQNPVFLLDHDPKTIIGHATRLWIEHRPEGKALMATVEMLPAGQSARADEAWAAIQHGSRKGISIGFIPIEAGAPILPDQYGKTFRKVGLLEISSVAIPSCPTCLVSAVHTGKDYAMPCECEKTKEIEIDITSSELVQMVNAVAIPMIAVAKAARANELDLPVSDAELGRMIKQGVEDARNQFIRETAVTVCRKLAGKVD